MKKIRLVSLLLITFAVLILAACDGGEDPAVAFCGALTELNETAPTIAALGDAANLAQIVQLGTALDNNWQALADATEDMDDATQSTFAPYHERYTAIPAITQESPLPAARTSLDAKNVIASEAYGELYPGRCP